MNSIMSAAVKRKIFTQSHREIVENDLFRVSTTDINSGSLLTIRDITLGAMQQLELPCNADQTLILVPVTGSLTLIRGDYIGDLFPGESQVAGNETIIVSNPFDKQLVNFLVIETDVPAKSKGMLKPGYCLPETGSHHHFDINSRLNQLVPVTDLPVNNLVFTIGKFSGRHGCTLSKHHRQPNTFLYVLEGAFEAAECLLEDRDGLLVQGVSACDWEALSDNAIILVIEY